MSENEMIILWNRIDKLYPLMKRIERRLFQKNIQSKEVLNTKEAAIYIGCSIWSIYRLRRTGKLKTSRPNNGRLFIEKIECYNWMLSIATVCSTEKVTEAEKMSILNPGKN